MPRPVRILGLGVVLAGVLVLLGWAVPAPVVTSAAAATVSAQAQEWTETDLLFFWGDGCPHCAAQKVWLDQAAGEYPDLTIHDFEVWYDEQNRAVLVEVAREMGFEPRGVPVTVLGQRHWVGWSDIVQTELTAHIAATLAAGADEVPDEATGGADVTTIDVPVLGEVTLGESLVASTLIIGFVDGMNPCSLWVITVLLAIVVRTGNRRRVVAIGATFLVVTAIMYGLFIMGIYSALGLVAHLGQVQVLVAVVAGVLGLLSVKDYFAFKQGPSMTISDAAKPGLYQRMRAAAGHERLLPALAATVVLAVGVSFIEIPCTAGFPLIWAGLLEANNVGFVEGLGLLVLFMIPYLLDELVVFGVAVFAMRSLKMQERHGRLLKLLAGAMMIALALTMLLAPEAMSHPVLAVVIFLAAVGAAVGVHLVMRRLRPQVFAGDPEGSDRAGGRARSRAGNRIS